MSELNKDYVICPVCNKHYKLISTTHVRVHGYSNIEEFKSDYPNAQLVCDSYSKRRSQILGDVNRSEVMRRKASEHCKRLNQDSQRQSQKGAKGWTDERKQQKRDQLRETVNEVNTSSKYEDYRRRRQEGLSYGKRHEYKTSDGRVLKLKSFLECTAVKFFEVNQFSFEYEKIEIRYMSPGDNKEHTYYPDFYLKDYNLLIETKPEEYQRDLVVIAKKEASESKGYNFMFVTYHDLKNYKDLITKIQALRIE